MNKKSAVMVTRGLLAVFTLCMVPVLLLLQNGVNKPFAVMLVLGIVGVFAVCLFPILWKLVRSIRDNQRSRTRTLALLAVTIVAFDAWALYEAYPKGGRTIAQRELPGGRELIVRHYRYGWFEYPTVRLYARDTTGA